MTCNCRDEGNLITICEGHLRERIEAQYVRFPFLRDLGEACCGCFGCEVSRVGSEYGWDAAHAYEQVLQDKWLLGEDAGSPEH